MISIDLNSLHDLAAVEKAIQKLTFIRDALRNKKEDDAEALESRAVWYHAFNPAPYLADAIRRFEELTPEDLDEMNAGPAESPTSWIDTSVPGPFLVFDPISGGYKMGTMKTTPFMDPQEAIQNDGIVCLIDGEKRKFLSRYVRTVHDMEWQDYLDRFELPSDYPRTASDIIEQRSAEAVKNGFGKHERNPEPKVAAAQLVEQVKIPVRRHFRFGKRNAVPDISVKVEVGGRKLGGML